MNLKSKAFENGDDIPSKYTCDGEDVSPPLAISYVPEGAQSLVLIVDDPDVPRSIRESGLWVHWTVWNIDPDVKQVEEGSVPSGGIEGVTDFGEPGYGGPCPPDGEHRYFFKLYALDAKLELETSARKQDILDVMEGHIVDECELMGKYDRNR